MIPSQRRQGKQYRLRVTLSFKRARLPQVHLMAREQLQIPKGHIDSGARIRAVMHVGNEK
jgi:hypothetical protein